MPNHPASSAPRATEHNLIEPDSQGAAQIEQHGFDFIHEEARYLKPRALFSFWWGSNITIVYISIGAVVLSLGLALWQTILIELVCTAGWVIIGLLSITGPRSGVPTLTITRAPFGVRGNLVNSVFSYAVQIGAEVLNALLIILALTAVAQELGWEDPGKPGAILFAAIAIALPAVIAVMGHRLLFFAQRVIAIALSVVMLLVAIWTVPHFDWAQTATVQGSELFAVVLIGFSTIFANPLSYGNVAADYPRYLPSRTSGRAIIWWTVAGVGTVSLLLEVLGSGIMTAAPGVAADPVGGFKILLPEWLFVIYIVNAALGAMSNMAITFYSSGLTMQAIGIPLRRWRATFVDVVISFALVVCIELFLQSFSTVLSNFLAFLNVWAGPFVGIYLVDAIYRRFRYDPVGVHDLSKTSPYWGRGGVNVVGIVALVVGIVVGFLTVHASVYVGPIAAALSGGDLAWLLPGLISAAVYALFAHRTLGRRAQDRSMGAAMSPIDGDGVTGA